MIAHNYAAPEYIFPSSDHTATIIMIHGMGDKASNWSKHVHSYNWPSRWPHVKFIFPQAPIMDLSLIPGSRMASWFDVLTSKDVASHAHDETGMHRSSTYLQSLIETEVQAGVPASRILLGGFSQGGAIALLTGIALPYTIGGVFSLCGYLAMIPRVLEKAQTGMLMPEGMRNSQSVFLGNGTNDPKVKFPWAEWSAGALKVMGFDVELRSYLRMGHSMHPQSLKEIEKWIDNRMAQDEEWADVMFS